MLCVANFVRSQMLLRVTISDIVRGRCVQEAVQSRRRMAVCDCELDHCVVTSAIPIGATGQSGTIQYHSSTSSVAVDSTTGLVTFTPRTLPTKGRAIAIVGCRYRPIAEDVCCVALCEWFCRHIPGDSSVLALFIDQIHPQLRHR